MAKNKNKNKITARNSNQQLPMVEKQAQVQKAFTAINALDYAMNCDYGYLNPSLSLMNGYNNASYTAVLSLQQYLLTSLYKTYGILAKIVDVPVNEAFKNGGFELEADSIDEDDIKDLKDSIQENNDIEQLKTANKWARLFGGGALVAITGNDLKSPINTENLYNNHLEFLAVDRWQLTYSKSDVRLKNGTWLLTQYDTVDRRTSAEIHPSRVFVLHGKKAPYLIQQQVQGWGISVYEQIFQDMSQFFKARNVLFELLDEAKTDILKLASLQQALVSTDSEQALQQMCDAIARSKNYKSMLTLSKDDDYEQKQISFSGIEGISKEIRIMMSGAADIPVNKLWGEGVTGFGSGEDSLENFNSMVEGEVRTPNIAALKWMLKLRCFQLFGREVEDLIIIWKKLRVLSEIDEQNIHDHKLANVLQLYDRQLLSPQELMQYLKKQQIFIHETKALKGELDDMPLSTQMGGNTEVKDITKD